MGRQCTIGYYSHQQRTLREDASINFVAMLSGRDPNGMIDHGSHSPKEKEKMKEERERK